MNMEFATNFEAVKFMKKHNRSVGLLIHSCYFKCQLLATTIIKTHMRVINHKPPPH